MPPSASSHSAGHVGVSLAISTRVVQHNVIVPHTRSIEIKTGSGKAVITGGEKISPSL